MSYHISTNNIHVFPLARNRKNDRSARLFYENNIANIVRQVVDRTGFIISPKSEEFKVDYAMSAEQPSEQNLVRYSFSVKQDFSFNLYGYYFMINKGTTIIEVDFNTQGTDIADVYAAIVVTDGEIEGQDDDVTEKYNGLHVLSSKSFNPQLNAGLYTAYFKLFSIKTSLDTSSNRVFEVIMDDSSYLKLDAGSLDISIKRIDGKRSL